jgi:UDP-N-acetylmuramyl pentapeptide phosphotransferase/UDP-N-acetylglucosamine-1-phosphate transferase
MLARTMIAAAVAFTIAVILTPLLRNAARRRGYLDVPNEASSHSQPTPRNGGFAIFAGFVTAFWLVRDQPAIAKLFVVVVINALLPAIDEFRPLPRAFRLVAQLVLAIASVIWLRLGPTTIELPYLGSIELGAAGTVLAITWLVAVVNCYNFMDGLNGLSSTAAIICGTATAIMCWQHNDLAGAVVAAGLAGGAAGFLPWNLPSGSVFMGDVGSATLGFVLGLLSLRLVIDGASPIPALLPLLSFCSDAFLAIIRRAAKGERFFATRHRAHYYQWLNQQGWSHPRVTGLWDVLMLSSAVFATAWPYLPERARITGLGAVVTLHAGVFLWVASRQRPA